MDDFAEKMISQIEEIHDDVVKYRRYLHAHPEVGFETRNTESYIRSILVKEGIEVLPSTVGVMARIAAPRNADGYIAFRADIDALPVQEQNELEYKSISPGLMHACGHDVHTAMMLGAARLIYRNRAALTNNVLIFFQPAAEGPDGGGARLFLEDVERAGLLPKIRAIAALHVNSEVKSGAIGIKYGHVLASMDEFDVEILGKGGHSGWPHKAMDALAMAVKFVYEMQAFMSIAIDPLDSAVFSVGKLRAGSSWSTVPDTAQISGAIRALSEETRERVINGAKRLIRGLNVYSSMDCRIDVRKGVPALVNNDEKTMQAEIIAKKLFDSEEVEILKKASMAADDFATFAQAVPATFLWLGTCDPAKGYTEIMHSPKFNIDEEVLPIGVRFLTHLAFELV